MGYKKSYNSFYRPRNCIILENETLIHKFYNEIFSRFPLTRYDLITIVDFEKCAIKSETCSKMVCPYDKEEVCGTDGVTYANSCHLSRVTCTSGKLGVIHE